MITHDSFLKKWLGKRYQENSTLKYQCTALAKKYAEEVYGIKGLSFGGSAINGWEKKGNLDNYFDRPDMPRQGDICFSGPTPSNPYGHVWVHHDEYVILEQNGGNGKGDGLGINAIRLAKAPANAVGFLRPKPMPTKHFLQGDNPDCSLLSTINCYCLNNGSDSRSFTQEVVNGYMVEYINKHPRDAFQFLKDRKYKIRYIPLNFKGAKVRLNKGDAVIFFLKGKTPQLNHYTCIKKLGDKYQVIDSTTSNINILDDIETAYKNGILNDNCHVVK